MACEILLVQRLRGDARHAAFAARCHGGTLRLGDVLTIAVSPEGTRHDINVTCTEIQRYEGVFADQLEENFGGRVSLEGSDEAMLSAHWTLLSG
ncbi:MAG TPA: hypothetical protein VID47_12965 [Actinomycetota bacterium]